MGHGQTASRGGAGTAGDLLPYPENDAQWDHARGTWLFDHGAPGATGLLFVVVTVLLLRRLEPQCRRRGAVR